MRKTNWYNYSNSETAIILHAVNLQGYQKLGMF